MCTSPLKILNPSTFISPLNGQKLYLNVPCGVCEECLKLYRLEWKVRIREEFVNCLNSGGYVLFDTLTYSPKYLPHLSDFVAVPKKLDFSCFSSYDIALFFKRLRKSLKHYGYDCTSKFRYFLCSEYGSVDYTTRPHYHVFFFVYGGFVPWFELSTLVSQAWSIYNKIDKSFDPIGRTDGVVYRGSCYVRQHNLFTDMSENCLRLSAYLSKYVTKDFEYMELVQKRLGLYILYLYEDRLLSEKKFKEELKFYKSFVVPFHRQSKSLGFSYFDRVGQHALFTRGVVDYNNGLPSLLPLFPSFKRKLFYRYYRDCLGVVHWKKTAFGLKYDLFHVEDSISKVNQRIVDYNLNNSVPLSIDGYDVFNLFRLYPKECRSIESCKDLLKSEYLTDFKNGFRNYCCHGFDFLNVKCFSQLDHGLYKHRYFGRGHYMFDSDIKVKDSLIPLSELEKNMLYDEKKYNEYIKLMMYNKQQGIKKSQVARLNERCSKLIKKLQL